MVGGGGAVEKSHDSDLLRVIVGAKCAVRGRLAGAADSFAGRPNGWQSAAMLSRGFAVMVYAIAMRQRCSEQVYTTACVGM